MTWLALAVFGVLIVAAGVKLAGIQDKGRRKEETEKGDWP